jgi:hypothetical protein
VHDSAVDRDDRGVRDRLEVALSVVDEVFADQPDVGVIDGCTYCYLESDLVLLGGDPSRIPDSLVARFAEEVLDHWTPEQYGPLWRRLAPRVIRLLVARQPGIDPGLLLRGLGPYGAGLTDWPAAQRSAMLDVLGAALDLALVDGRPPTEVVELLGGISHVDHELSPWTGRLDTLTGQFAEAGMARLACNWAIDLLCGNEPFWWWYPDDPIALGTAWLCSARVYDRIERFAVAAPRCKTAHDALVAIVALQRGDTSPWWYPTARANRARDSSLRGFVHLIPGMPSR